MAETTNEMNLPMINLAPMGAVSAVEPAVAELPAPTEMDMSVAIGSPTTTLCPSDITVYSQSITPVSYTTGDAVAAFDIVFSVGVNCGNGVTKTYQVVKRVGIDKCKIADDAMCSTPVSVVESNNEASKAAADTRKRFRVLAGLE